MWIIPIYSPYPKNSNLQIKVHHLKIKNMTQMGQNLNYLHAEFLAKQHDPCYKVNILMGKNDHIY